MDETQEIEESLRRALRHVPAPAGFTQRVTTRIAAREQQRSVAGRVLPGRLFRTDRRASWWMAAAAALALACGGGDLLHVRHQREVRREQAAEAEVDLALQLTSRALTEVQLDLDRSPAGRYTHLANGL